MFIPLSVNNTWGVMRASACGRPVTMLMFWTSQFLDPCVFQLLRMRAHEPFGNYLVRVWLSDSIVLRRFEVAAEL